MKTCKHCNQTFNDMNPKVFANHVRWCDKNPKDPRNKEYIEKQRKSAFESNKKIHGEKIKIKKNCLWCNNEFEVFEKPKNKKKKKFCSKSCSAKYSASYVSHHNIKKYWTKEKRTIASKRTIKLWQNKDYANSVMNHPNVKSRFTSKGEEEVKKYFFESFPEEDWTFGCIAKYKDKMINPDLWSREKKIVIEYDGIWHFKDIKGQLEEKQERDKLTEEWCIKNGYKLIRIKEEVYLENKQYWIDRIVEETKKYDEKVIKFY